jgi:hypothetical protein
MARKQAAPDPDRLVRDRIGAYHSEDDRFQVHSEGGRLVPHGHAADE